MTIKTPWTPWDDPPISFQEDVIQAERRVGKAEAYRCGYVAGYADCQARAQKLAEALRTVTAQLATYMESSAWEDDDGIAYDAADAALQEWDAAQKEGAHA